MTKMKFEKKRASEFYTGKSHELNYFNKTFIGPFASKVKFNLYKMA